MTWQMLLIAIVRIAGSLPVLRWPLAGGVLALLVDLSDLFLMDALGGVSHYQRFDKYLDQVYMACFLIVLWRWGGVARNVGLALYVYRLAGFIAFEATGSRGLLLFFPNLFELWFLFCAFLRHGGVSNPLSPKWALPVCATLVIVKFGQEYALHHARVFDSFTAFEAVDAVWDRFASILPI